MSSRKERIGVWTARQALRFSQITPLRGRGGYAAVPPAKGAGSPSRFPQALAEAALVEDFFQFFLPFDVKKAMVGKNVLDFGSGYGGRTLEYARRFGPRFVWGVEPFENVIEQSRRYA